MSQILIPLGGVKMKVNESTNQLYLQQFKAYKQAQKMMSETENTNHSSVVSIGFSKEKQQIQYYVEQLKQSDDNTARIQELKEQVEQGKYVVSSEAIATALMRQL